MTMDDLRRDREVGSWIRAEAPIHAPDRLRETIRSELAETRQESGPVLLMRRGMLLSPARAVLAAAVILGFGVVAGGFLGIRGNTGEVVGPSPTNPPVSSPSASPSPSPPPTPVPTVSGLALPPGQTTTEALTPAMQFSVPAGWLRTDDRKLAYRISPVDAGYGVQGDESVFFDGVGVFVGPLAGQPDGTIGPVEGVGTTSADLAAWLSTRPQLTATQPDQTTLAGRPAYPARLRLVARRRRPVQHPVREPARQPRRRGATASGSRGRGRSAPTSSRRPTGRRSWLRSTTSTVRASTRKCWPPSQSSTR